MDQDGGLSGAQVRLLIDQMQKIWEDADVEVTSGRYGDRSRSGQALVSLRILRIPPPPSSARLEPTLAWVALDEHGQLAPHLFVSLPAIKSIVYSAEYAGYPVRQLARGIHDELVARAAGRAAAHELGHFLLQRAGHQTEGLMRRAYALRDLLGDWLRPFQVSANDRVAVRNEIAAIARAQAAF
ncbi:MAG TPA: hypothetical protein VH497_03465 [Vicinamibacterales bacterium]